jgi:hypothetical protein
MSHFAKRYEYNMSLICFLFLILTRVADPHHLNADPVPDPAYHLNADLGPDPAPHPASSWSTDPPRLYFEPPGLHCERLRLSTVLF